MIELVDLSNWKKQKDILDELYKNYNINISSRTWRSKEKLPSPQQSSRLRECRDSEDRSANK